MISMINFFDQTLKEPGGDGKDGKNTMLSPLSNGDAYLWLTLSDISHIPVGGII